jgi:single-strand DNA-binding protein
VSLTLRVQSVQLLGGRGDGSGGFSGGASEGGYAPSASSSSRIPSAGEITEPIDDLPF